MWPANVVKQQCERNLMAQLELIIFVITADALSLGKPMNGFSADSFLDPSRTLKDFQRLLHLNQNSHPCTEDHTQSLCLWNLCISWL